MKIRTLLFVPLLLVVLVGLFGAGLLGCATGQGRGATAKVGSGSAAAACNCPCARPSGQDKAQGPAPAPPWPAGPSDGVVPVTAKDPVWGNPDAPVTIVEFSDFQCPFCARVGETMDELRRIYGPAQLRLVWKNYPLPFHNNARPASEAAMTVLSLGGSEAFWKFHDLVFANQRELSADNYARWAVMAGVDGGKFETVLSARGQAAKVDEDVALAARLGIRGTPVFRINGVPLTGAQPIDNFREVIDSQLAAAKALVSGGTPAGQIYGVLSAKNAQAAPAAADSAPEPEPEDTAIWRVPVEKFDPTRGPADALVTLVLFSDFQCPFCKRVDETVAGLEQKYGADLRIVWKDYPLPFHDRAVPAAVLARVALAKKGIKGFWQAHRALFEGQENLDDRALKVMAKGLGLSWTEIQKAIADRRFKDVFKVAEDLAKTLKVSGTPCAFVNGYRVAGAVPVEKFVEVIDAQFAKAKAMADDRRSQAGIYEAIAKSGQQSDGPERREVEAPTRNNPSRGNAAAKVTVQIFGDFQCPFCLRANPTLAQLEKRFPGRLRFIWRNYPMPFHDHAALAAEAAQEVFAQKGAPTFWEYHDLLFAAQAKGELERPNLEKLAQKLGVDMKRFRAALDARTHQPVVDQDVGAAKKAELDGTPVFVINGYVISGPRPLPVFEQVVTRALAESEPAQAVGTKP
jgi:protein-disulfide isomerase